MEAETSLVGAYGAVELHAVAYVDVYLALVVGPWHAERDDTLWLYEPLYEPCILKLRMLVVDISY